MGIGMKRAITAWWKKHMWRACNTHPPGSCKCSSGIKRMDKLADNWDIN